MSLLKKLFKKEKEELQICSPASGVLSKITELSDDVFSKMLMGDGFYIDPNLHDICEIVSPITGKVENIFETSHAISLSNQKIHVLLHLGLDTVEMKGLPFEILVEAGQSVTEGQSIAKMDIAKIIATGRTAEIITVFPELAKNSWNLKKKGIVDAGEQIGEINR